MTNKNLSTISCHLSAPWRNHSAIYLMSCLNDPITVTCKFQKAKLIPLSFEWNHHLYSPLKTVFQYQTTQGTEKLIIFSCQAQQNIFDLALNLKTLSWKIKAVHGEP